MRTVHFGPAAGVAGQVILLAALAQTVGLGAAGWLVGVATSVVTNVALARALEKSGAEAMGPGNGVTVARATLVGGVAAFVADSLMRPVPIPTLVSLAVVALVLDAVDGPVARRTGTASRLGWRFDGEVDAFLILVLSIQVARTAVPAALILGAARYVFLVAGLLLPWLRAPLPDRYWRKVATGAQGVALTIAAAEVLPYAWTLTVLGVSLALLTESFGRDVWWLWRRRHCSPTATRTPRETGSGTHPSARPERSTTG